MIENIPGNSCCGLEPFACSTTEQDCTSGFIVQSLNDTDQAPRLYNFFHALGMKVSLLINMKKNENAKCLNVKFHNLAFSYLLAEFSSSSMFTKKEFAIVSIRDSLAGQISCLAELSSKNVL